MQYPVTLVPDGDGFFVKFVDIPEAITSGATREEALSMAHDALVTVLDFYFDDRRALPPPSKAKRGQDLVTLEASLAAKVLLLNEMVAQNVRPADLARKLGTTPQEVTRLTNLKHTTRIDGIADALRALGKSLELRVV